MLERHHVDLFVIVIVIVIFVFVVLVFILIEVIFVVLILILVCLVFFLFVFFLVNEATHVRIYAEERLERALVLCDDGRAQTGIDTRTPQCHFNQLTRRVTQARVLPKALQKIDHVQHRGYSSVREKVRGKQTAQATPIPERWNPRGLAQTRILTQSFEKIDDIRHEFLFTALNFPPRRQER
jgi:Ca2+/Na+ antiporter